MDPLGWLPLDEDLSTISEIEETRSFSPCDRIRGAFSPPSTSNCTSYTGNWEVFGNRGMADTGECWTMRAKGCRHLYGGDIAYTGPTDFHYCLTQDVCVLLKYSFKMIEYYTQLKPPEACLLCQSPCETLAPFNLQPYCTNNRSDLAAGFSGAAFIGNRNRTTFNGHLAGFAMCAIQQDMQRRMVDWQLPLWKVAAQGLMFLPSAFLFPWLLLCFTLPWISGDVMVSQWSVPPDMELQSAVEKRARQLCRQMRRGEVETRPADKVSFYMDFGFFLWIM